MEPSPTQCEQALEQLQNDPGVFVEDGGAYIHYDPDGNFLWLMEEERFDQYSREPTVALPEEPIDLTVPPGDSQFLPIDLTVDGTQENPLDVEECNKENDEGSSKENPIDLTLE
ncbi:hypothetical protein PM082_004736 [Marasmius tenuissimus]|nr:hypothetical protein PM082_004736 [Marasmius tenuissimus]